VALTSETEAAVRLFAETGNWIRELAAFCLFFAFFFSLILSAASDKREDKSIEFRADTYSRDARTNSVVGKGNAWARKGDKELKADEIHVDFNTELAIAKGNVQIQDGQLLVWCSQANFSLNSDEATFDNATVVSGQLVLTGKTVEKVDATTLEIEDGTYSNCNVDQWTPGQAASCPLDWRISGSRFRIELGGYAHLYDVLVQTKSVPVFYSPYLIFPMKTARQTGLLPLTITSNSNLGTGVSVPVFFALNEWQDLLATYTHFDRVGMHLGLKYRYMYTPESNGFANIFLLEQKFGGPDNPDNASGKSKTFGLLGEGAINLHNVYTFSDRRSQTRQMVSLVSNPYYSFNYLGDLPARADLGYLRNQFSIFTPRDEWFFAAQVQYFQSLTVSKDSGIDRGAVLQLPTLTVAKTNTHLGTELLSYEFDAQFTNFHRNSPFDDVPTSPGLIGLQVDNDPLFDDNDYLRTGRRLQLEPRFVLNTPMPTGFMLQPLIKAGTLIYHFGVPSSDFIQRYYLQTEIPFSFQVQKAFQTSFADFDRIQHVFQPRVIFASDLYANPTTSHPFFRNVSADISNPRFDDLDILPHFQYLRFELINRVRARRQGDWRRFFLLQASEQYNLRTDASDPRYRNRVGPIEILGSLEMGRFSWQVQAQYGLELTKSLNGVPLATPVRPVVFGSGLVYTAPGSDIVRLNLSINKSADPSLTNHRLSLQWYRYLPLFFDVEAQFEYNLLKGELISYGAGFHFRRKPKSCWHLSLIINRNAFGNTFTQFGFGFDFGSR